MSAFKRDDFSESTKTTLGKRVGFHCSNPDCGVHTVGPHSNPSKSVSIGIAAHITGAVPNSARYNDALTSVERSATDNGIWLCASCSYLIDKDEHEYPEELLQEWKHIAETLMLKELKGTFKIKKPYLEATLTWDGSSRAPRGYSDKNPSIVENGVNIIQIGAGFPPPIIYWELTWRYSLEIHNNSSLAAVNLKIESVGHVHLSDFGQLPEVNHLLPFESLDLLANYKQRIESDHVAADAIISKKIPDKLSGLVLKLSYMNEERKEFTTYIKVIDGVIIKRDN